MKRHFSNRGEALSEVTAARSVTDRKTSIKAAFRSQVDRRARTQPWFPQPLEIPTHPNRKPSTPKKNGKIFL
jgi:hypothetical protein